MSTSTDLVNETLSYLYAGSHDPINTLNGSLDASTTTVAFNYDLGSARVGSVIAVDLEHMYVLDILSEPSRQLTVIRGFEGSTAATHADDAVVTVNPKFSNFRVLNAINNDLRDLSANGLFQVKEVTLTYSSSVQGYDLTSVTDTVLEILQVNYDDSGPYKTWPEINSYKLRRSSDSSDFPSGLSLVLYQEGESGRDLRVKFSCPFGTFTALAQNVTSTTGLPATAQDIPPLGAAMRLQSVREGQRNFNESQPATRRSSEVPPGAQLVGARALKELRRDRIRVEASRLRRQWPAKRRTPA